MAGLSDLRFPPMAAAEDTKAGHLREVVQLGDQWLKSRRSWKSIAESLDLLLDGGASPTPAGQSGLKIPRAKRQVRELVSILANMRPTASNEADNPDYEHMAAVYNQLDRDWWYNTFADRKFKDAFQAAAGTGTAYLEYTWDVDLRNGRGGIRTDVWDAREVLLINPPKDNDLQRCYAVVTRERVPLHILWKRFPLRAHELVPEYGVRGYTQQGLDYVQSFMQSPLKALAGKFNDDPPAPDDIFPSTDVYTIYIDDLSINLTGHPIEMGVAGASWGYTVPAYGQQIPSGLGTWEGLPQYRKANEIDARIYPMRRKIIGTATKILYDNTSEWLHGRVPLCRFSFDDWYSEALGFPLTRDIAAIEDETNQIARGISDMTKVALDPGLIYDENLIGERSAQKVNPRQPGQRIRANMAMGEPIKPLLPAGYQRLEAYVFEFMKWLGDTQGWITGASDMSAIAKAKQLPSEGTIEKMLQLAGPISQDMAREMEQAMRDGGDLRRWLNCQFRTKRDVLRMLGSNAMTVERVNFDPTSLIPTHLESENPEQPSKASYLERSREACSQINYYVVPGSMTKVHQLQYFQKVVLAVKQLGLPMDPFTIAEMIDLDGFGKPPDDVDADTVIKRWIYWQEFMGAMQQKFQQPPGGGERRGRPGNVNGRSAKIKGKDGNSRVTMTSA